MSQITTHILDISKGLPAAGISVSLEKSENPSQWTKIGSGTSNTDGRVSDLLKEEEILSPGIYRLVFDTGDYFQNNQQKSFYPFVSIVFELKDTAHYHVPLLLSPYGYSTYRGS